MSLVSLGVYNVLEGDVLHEVAHGLNPKYHEVAIFACNVEYNLQYNICGNLMHNLEGDERLVKIGTTGYKNVR